MATSKTFSANQWPTSGRGDFASGINVGGHERVISAVGGGALALFGVTRGSWWGMALAVVGGTLVYRAATGHCSVYQALGRNTAMREGGEGTVRGNLGLKVDRSIRIDAPAEQMYRFWRNLENLPRFMTRLESVRTTSPTRSHWVVRGPAGKSLEWDAEIFNDVPGELIAWRSIGAADVEHAGSVRFEQVPNGRGTDVRVSLQYDPPGGAVGHAVAALWGEDAGQQIERDLEALKRHIEAGGMAGTGLRTAV